MNWMESVATPKPATGIAHDILRDLDGIPSIPLYEEGPGETPTKSEQGSTKTTPIKSLLKYATEQALRRRARDEEEAIEEEKSKFSSVKRWALRGIAVFSSGSCALASIYFSRQGLIESQPPVIAMVMAITIVATLTVAPEIAVSLTRKRKRLTALVVSLISAVATLFSMSQTVQAIYGSATARIEKESTDATIDSVEKSEDRAIMAQVSLLQDRKARLQKGMEIDQSSYAAYQGNIDSRLALGEAPDSKAITLLVANRNSAIARVRAAETEISKVEKEIQPLLLQAQRGEAVSGKVEERDTFPRWLAGILKVPDRYVEFSLAVFPALFIDIIAPVMLVVAFAL